MGGSSVAFHGRPLPAQALRSPSTITQPLAELCNRHHAIETAWTPGNVLQLYLEVLPGATAPHPPRWRCAITSGKRTHRLKPRTRRRFEPVAPDGASGTVIKQADEPKRVRPPVWPRSGICMAPGEPGGPPGRKRSHVNQHCQILVRQSARGGHSCGYGSDGGASEAANLHADPRGCN